jgi:hypothetical protein
LERDFLFSELRRVEYDVAEGERHLAHQESLLISLKRQNQDLPEIQANLEMLRTRQQQLQQDRTRILSLLQP